MSDPATPEEPSDAGSESSQPSTSSDICGLITEQEVVAVLGVATAPEPVATGALDSGFGGQCVWASDGAALADPASDAPVLELDVWDPAGYNPAPAEAPTAGDPAVAEVPGGGGWFFTTDAFVLRIVTFGNGVDTAAAKALVPTIQGRI